MTYVLSITVVAISMCNVGKIASLYLSNTPTITLDYIKRFLSLAVSRTHLPYRAYNGECNIPETEKIKVVEAHRERRRQPLKKNYENGPGKRRTGRPRRRWLNNTWEVKNSWIREKKNGSA